MLLFVSLRQSRGALVVGLKYFLCIVLGLLFNMIMYLVMVFFTIYGCLFRGDFVGFYLGSLSYVGKFADPLLYC